MVSILDGKEGDKLYRFAARLFRTGYGWWAETIRWCSLPRIWLV